MRILVLDDEEAISLGVCRMIEHMQKPYVESVISFCQAGEAMAYLKTNPVDLLITDIQMPGRSGLSLIDSVSAAYPQISFIVISGYDCFEYVDSAYKKGVADYIRKPISRQKLSERLDLLEEKFRRARLDRQEQDRRLTMDEIGRLFDKKTASNQVLPASFAHWRRYLPEGTYFLLCLAERTGQKTTLEAAALLLQEQLKQAALLATPEHDGLTMLSFFRYGMELLLFAVPPGCEEQAHAAVAQMEKLCRAQGLQGAALSDRVSGYEGLPVLFGQILETMQYRLLCPDQPVIFYPDCAKRRDIYPGLDEVGRQTARKLRADEPDTLQSYLCGLFDVKQLEPYSMLATEQLYLAVLGAICAQADPIWQQKVRPIPLATWNSLPDLVKDLMRLATESRESMESTDTNGYDTIRGKAEAYIGLHYDQKLTLAMVSNHVSVSYNYFSKLFHDLFGMSFSAYLSKIRIEQAKELIEHSSLSIAEIAQKVGYCSPKHFSRAYKEYYGHSPRKMGS